MTSSRRYIRIVLATSALFLMAAPVWSQEVGKISAVEGTAEVDAGGQKTPATVGMAVARGNVLRTGRPGRLQVVFQDDTMLSLADDSEITIDDQVFAGQEGIVRSLTNLVRGKVRAVVSDYYLRTGSAYEIRTKTAVAGVRGTEFVVKYDPDSEVTEVVGITGVVAVHSAFDATGPGVLVTASEATLVAAGALPAQPRKLDRDLFQKELDDVEFIGGAGAPSISSAHAAVTGANVADPESAGVVAGGNVPAAGPGGLVGRPDAGDLIGQSPAAVQGLSGIDIDVGNPR